MSVCLPMPVCFMKKKRRNTMHDMHENSLIAHTEEEPKLCKRMIKIIADVQVRGNGTDKEIALRMGFSHKSAVQPRISDLIKMGKLVEVDKSKDPETGKRVRVVDIPDREPVRPPHP